MLAIKYKDGVMVAADTAVSYGSMKHYKGQQRMAKIGDETMIACGGEMSDFQEVVKTLKFKQQEDEIQDDGA